MMNATLFNKLAVAGILCLTAVWPLQAGNITVKGSDTMVILAQKWAEVYMRKNPAVKIQVNGGGSGTGFAALLNRTADLADASRTIKPHEIEGCLKAFGKRPTEYKVALDGLSIYVHTDNPVNEVTIAQLDKIFTGKVKNWKEVGGPDAPITIYSRENNSGSYEIMKEQIMKHKDFAATAQTMPGTAALLQAVSRDKNGIGYGGVAYGRGAKTLKVKKSADSPAIEPTEANVLNKVYPIWRYLYIYVNPAQDKGEIGAYLNWLRSDEGQEAVKEVGYYPLPPTLRQK